MHWYDYAGMALVGLLAIWADYDAGRALRASLFTYFMSVEGNRWIRSYELRQVFGPSVYKHLAKLVDIDLLEKRVTQGGPERGMRPDSSYRRKGAQP